MGLCVGPDRVLCKAAEPIVSWFGLRIHVGPVNPVLDGVQIPNWKGNFWEVSVPLKSMVQHMILGLVKGWALQKMYEPIEIPLVGQSYVSPWNHVLERSTSWRHLVNTIKLSVWSVVMWVVATITVAICCIVSYIWSELWMHLLVLVLKCGVWGE